jgi:putative membrane protein
MSAEKHPVRGILAGIAGGLIASWVMNEFMAGPGKVLTQAAESPEELREAAQKQKTGEPDATMKTADAIAAKVTGGQHLTYEQEQKGGPIVHYAFGALVGGVYGALAEYSPLVRSGFGTNFGTALFASADLLAVPTLRLGPSLSEQSKASLATPLAAHLVYGATTELVRRILRKVL